MVGIVMFTMVITVFDLSPAQPRAELGSSKTEVSGRTGQAGSQSGALSLVQIVEILCSHWLNLAMLAWHALWCVFLWQRP